MAWNPQSFNEACKRAAGRRAYNKRRRLARQRRVTAILRLLDVQPDLSGRNLAATLKVHEATISRDLKFIRKVRRHYLKISDGEPMQARSFRWLRGGAWEITYLWQDGVRLR